MAQVIVTLKIMPASPDTDLNSIEANAKREIQKFASSGQFKTEIEPIAFGLKALKILFAMDESKGSTDKLESKIRGMNDVNSVEVVDVRRAVG